MKKFVPMSDELLSEQGEMTGTLVPFNPEFLVAIEIGNGRKPVNWVSKSGYRAAYQRIKEIWGQSKNSSLQALLIE
jgi:hypothetical protein